MPRFIITGSPGAGKTTLLAALAERGHVVVADSARAVIAARLAQGLAPRPAPQVFALQVLARDIDNYRVLEDGTGHQFYDRSIVDALGMVHETGAKPKQEIEALLTRYPYFRPAFLLPPWEAIYRQDAERDQTFAQAVQVHARIRHWYAQCGHALHEVPGTSVQDRCDHVLQVIAAGAR